jgi:hypothetical protein
MVNMNDMQATLVAMDHASFVWISPESLTDADQTAWDSVSEEGKGKILDYNVKRATNNSNSNSKFRNNDKRYAKQQQSRMGLLTEDSKPKSTTFISLTVVALRPTTTTIY